MKNIYKPSLKAGARVRVLATNELGTIADKQLIRKNGQTKVYCKVRLDKSPDQDTWYFADQLGDTKECATVTMADEKGRTLVFNVTQYYDKNPEEDDIKVVLKAGDGSRLLDHRYGFHFNLASLFLKALVE